MAHEIVWNPSALGDLLDIYDWIAANADTDVALRYVRKVEAFANALAEFPARGTPRDHLAPALRTITHKRKIIIAFKIERQEVHILRVVRTARDIEPLFVDETE